MTTESDAASGAAVEVPAPVDAETTVPATEQPDQTTSEPPTEPPKDREQKAAEALQRRLSKRTGEYYQQKARADQLEQEIAALRQRSQDDAPEDRKPGRDEVESRASELMQEREIASKVNALMTKGKSIEGFEAAASAVVDELGLINNGRPTAALHVLLDTDSPAELIAHIGSDPELLESLAGLSPTRLAARIARIEDAMKAAKAPKTSAAPPPLKPVTGAASTDPDPSRMTDKQYAEWRRKQIAARR